MAQTEPAPPSSTTEPRSNLFVRNATGLVRGVPAKSSIIINLIPGHPTQTLAATFFFALTIAPGGNVYLGIALVLPMVLAFSYAFGLLTSMIPRSGGDYVLVSRVIHPVVGLMSSFCMTVAGLLSNAYFGLAFVTVGLGPGLTGIGLIGHNTTLVKWGTTLSNSHKWEFIFGALMMVAAGLIMTGGWRRVLRIQNTLFWMVTGSLVVCGLVALFTSHSTFIHNFNNFARPYTHSGNTYGAVIKAANKGGINTHPPFSFGNTIPVIGILATTAVYSYWTTFVGGELRQGGSRKTANNMAIGGTIALAALVVFGWIFFRTFGHGFEIAANSGNFPSQIAIANTPFFFLTSASVGSTIFAVIVFVGYIVFWPLIMYISMLQQTRMLFAYSFDGILAKRVTAVSRAGSPYIAVIIAVIGSIIVLYWGIHSSNFFQVLAYATLIQLVGMTIVGVTAAVVPWRRAALYRASAAQFKILGIPAVAVAGVAAIISGVLIWIIYLHYPALGLSDKSKFFTFVAVTLGLAIVYYIGAKLIRRAQGVDIDLAYAEVPPE
ncbi:MAG TPA: amino acid permease [Solirubrobacteraceae bacterium]|nr:amino acid permease [Solirubrobacteraceae bacterium]